MIANSEHDGPDGRAKGGLDGPLGSTAPAAAPVFVPLSTALDSLRDDTGRTLGQITDERPTLVILGDFSDAAVASLISVGNRV